MKIAVYLGSSSGTSDQFQKDAAGLGSWIGQNHHTLVYGGASVGTMGVLANAVIDAGGEVIGVMPRFMINGHKEHHDLPEFIITDDMSSRRKKMMELADVYAALPGGPGTLEEVSEVISSLRLHLIHGPCFILNTDGYYDCLKGQLDTMVQYGFVNPDEINMVYFVSTVEQLEQKIGELDD